MDSRDVIIIALVGVGVWLWWKARNMPLPIGDSANAQNGSSMAPGAAQQTQVGPATIRGIDMGGPRTMVATLGGGATASAITKALLTIDKTPQPVAVAPMNFSGTTAGIGPIGPHAPTQQQLNPVINPAPGAFSLLGVRGIA